MEALNMDSTTTTQITPVKDEGAVEDATRLETAPGQPAAVGHVAAPVKKMTPAHVLVLVLGTIAFLYFARPVVLPIILACVSGMTLKPLIRLLSEWHIPPAL